VRVFAGRRTDRPRPGEQRVLPDARGSPPRIDRDPRGPPRPSRSGANVASPGVATPGLGELPMEAVDYLQRLTTRLADGLARAPAAFRERHTAYLRAAQNADGGWSGREGGSDLYYTAFGLRGLAMLDSLAPAVTERAAAFLRHSLTQQASVVDFFSL